MDSTPARLIKGEKGETPKGFGMYNAPLPRWLMHVLGPVFLNQDAVFLHHQQNILEKDTGFVCLEKSYVHVRYILITW